MNIWYCLNEAPSKPKVVRLSRKYRFILNARSFRVIDLITDFTRIKSQAYKRVRKYYG